MTITWIVNNTVSGKRELNFKFLNNKSVLWSCSTLLRLEKIGFGIEGRFRADHHKTHRHGCFYKLRVLLVGVLIYKDQSMSSSLLGCSRDLGTTYN